MNFKEVKEFILEKLKNELDSRLSYHGVHHTIDVIEAATRIATLQNITGEELILLQTAALFHDTGFLFAYKGHELESAAFARKTLPLYNYSSKQIKIICELILATEVPQKPKSLLAEILCDADLDYLGRDDFIKISETLFAEWQAYNIIDSELDWYQLQINFLNKQYFHTKAANTLRDKKKIDNLNGVISRFSELKKISTT